MEITDKILSVIEFFGSTGLKDSTATAETLEKANAIVDIIKTMPVTYQQDGMGDDAIAYLHYQIRLPMLPNSDWYITEKDISGKLQQQAFGLARIGTNEKTELGYISLQELLSIPVIKLDLDFIPKTLADIKMDMAKVDCGYP